MSKAMALCLEIVSGVGPQGEMIQCVALAKGQPGLGLSPSGAVLWQSDEQPAIELAVDENGRLVLLRHASLRVLIIRGGRPLKVIYETPTVVLDQDEIDLFDRRLLVHLYGPSLTIHPPEPMGSASENEQSRKPRTQGFARIEPPAVPPSPPPPGRPSIPLVAEGEPAPEPLCLYELPNPGTVAAWNPKNGLIAVGCEDGTLLLLEWLEEPRSLETNLSVTLEERSPVGAIWWCSDGFFLCCRSGAGVEQFLSLGTDGELPPQVQWTTPTRKSYDGRHRAEIVGRSLQIFDSGERSN